MEKENVIYKTVILGNNVDDDLRPTTRHFQFFKLFYELLFSYLFLIFYNINNNNSNLINLFLLQ